MLELYKPHIEDLWFKEKMMSDEQTMAYNHAYEAQFHSLNNFGQIGMTDGS